MRARCRVLLFLSAITENQRAELSLANRTSGLSGCGGSQSQSRRFAWLSELTWAAIWLVNSLYPKTRCRALGPYKNVLPITALI